MSRYEFAADEELTAAKLNKNIIAGSYDAGETIAGATLPVPVYQDTSDNEFYKCDADDTTKLNFVGFAISNGTNGNAMDIQMNGIVRGFSGLDEGEKYYVQDAVGTIGKDKGEARVLVGVAISETELLILKEEEPDDKWNFQEIIFNDDKSGDSWRTFDICFSSDKNNLYILNTVIGTNPHLYLSRYKKDKKTGLFYYVNKITVDSGSAIGGGGVTFYDGKVYVIYINGAAGTQTCDRFDDDLTNETAITISGGANSERHGLTNNGAIFYVIDSSDNTGGYYTLSGTTLTRGGDISAITGLSNGNYIKTLANDGTSLIFIEGDLQCNSFVDFNSFHIQKAPLAGGAASNYSTRERLHQADYHNNMGLVPYGDSDVQEFIIFRMKAGQTNSSNEIWIRIEMKKISKSSL